MYKKIRLNEELTEINNYNSRNQNIDYDEEQDDGFQSCRNSRRGTSQNKKNSA